METAEKISVTITPDQLRQVRSSVERGEYASASEVMRAALRLWTQQRLEDEERLASIRARVRRSLDDPRPDVSLEEASAFIDRLIATGNADA